MGQLPPPFFFFFESRKRCFHHLFHIISLSHRYVHSFPQNKISLCLMIGTASGIFVWHDKLHESRATCGLLTQTTAHRPLLRPTVHTDLLFTDHCSHRPIFCYTITPHGSSVFSCHFSRHTGNPFSVLFIFSPLTVAAPSSKEKFLCLLATDIDNKNVLYLV